MTIQGPRILTLSDMIAAGLPRLAGWLHHNRRTKQDAIGELSRRFPSASADVIEAAYDLTLSMVHAADAICNGNPCTYPEVP